MEQFCILDDHKLFADCLSEVIIGQFPNSKVLIFDDPILCLQEIMKGNVRTLFLDINLGKSNGLEFLLDLRKHNSTLVSIVVSAKKDANSIDTARQNGANGFISKNESIEYFIQSLYLTASDKFYITENLQNCQNVYSTNNGKTIKLTQREIEFLRLLAMGFSAKEIAHRMKISEHTVNGYRKLLFAKFEVRNMIGLVKYTLELGI
ncbi:MAG: response regulator transcription factor [Chitinophagaceae bacterium]|nr:response regulator transcription factor [Chitinophagaceae bacterium]